MQLAAASPRIHRGIGSHGLLPTLTAREPGRVSGFFSLAAGVGRAATGRRFRRTDEMVSAWWLVVTFMAGGMAGVLVMAVMALAAEPERDDLPAAR